MQPSTFTAFDLQVTSRSPLLQYTRGRLEMGGIHWGQRKLLLSDLTFLLYYWKPEVISNPICVVAGAADGMHFRMLSLLFPEVTFHLYDPREFKVRPSDRIKIFTGLQDGYFTDTVAQSYAGRNDIFFICDIRRTGPEEIRNETARKYGLRYERVDSVHTYYNRNGSKVNLKRTEQIEHEITEEMETLVVEDMRVQENWIKIMRPVQSMIKFRLPYPEEGIKEQIFRYLRGQLFWGIWAPMKSTETRLVPDPELITDEWSVLEYQNMCYYHNVKKRSGDIYYNPLTGAMEPVFAPELLNDFDSIAETFLLMEYLKARNTTATREAVAALSNAITLALPDSYRNTHSIDSRRRGSSVKDKPIPLAGSLCEQGVCPIKSATRKSSVTLPDGSAIITPIIKEPSLVPTPIIPPSENDPLVTTVQIEPVGTEPSEEILIRKVPVRRNVRGAITATSPPQPVLPTPDIPIVTMPPDSRASVPTRSIRGGLSPLKAPVRRITRRKA